MASCRYCNAELHSNLKFCTNCGKSIAFSGIASGESQYSDNYETGNKKQVVTALNIFLALLVLFTFISAGFFFFLKKSDIHGEVICGISSVSNKMLFIDIDTKEIYKIINSVMAKGDMAFFYDNIYVSSNGGILIYDILRNKISSLDINEALINIAISKDGSTIYATNPQKNKLHLISLSKKKLVCSITAGDFPAGIAVDNYHNKIYVSNFKSNDITVINKDYYTPDCTIKNVGNGPYRLVSIDERSLLYSANYLSNDVTVISTDDNSIIEKISTGNSPSDIMPTDDKKNIYVANSKSNFISVIDVKKYKVIREINLGANPLCLGMSSDGTILVSVKGGKGNKILLINPVTFSVKDEINTENHEINNFIDIKCNSN